MSEATILEEVRALVRSRLHLDMPVEMMSDIRNDLKLDSLKQLELVVALENRFEICLSPDDETALATVGDVVRFIAREIAT